MTRGDLRAAARRLEDASDRDVDELLGFLEARARELKAHGDTQMRGLLGEAVERVCSNTRLYGARALSAIDEVSRRRAADSEVVLLDACLDLAGIFREHEDYQARWVR